MVYHDIAGERRGAPRTGPGTGSAGAEFAWPWPARQTERSYRTFEHAMWQGEVRRRFGEFWNLGERRVLPFEWNKARYHKSVLWKERDPGFHGNPYMHGRFVGGGSETDWHSYIDWSAKKLSRYSFKHA